MSDKEKVDIHPSELPDSVGARIYVGGGGSSGGLLLVLALAVLYVVILP